MLLKDAFSERAIANMDVALERACKLMPDVLVSHVARKFVAEKIVDCAKTRTQTLAGLTEAGRRAVAELAAEIVEKD
ncbi:hypothetical protein ACTGJ9_025855 [Bradyrhizobium sp. RDM12]